MDPKKPKKTATKKKTTKKSTKKATKKTSKKVTKKTSKRFSKKDITISKQDKKITIEGNWIIPNIFKHFTTLMSEGIAEKRRLIKEKKFKQNKNKKLRYKLNDGKLKRAKKNDKGKEIVNVYYD